VVPVAPVDDREPTTPALRINVLGALEFEPSLPGLSDPARSLLCYLAFHRDRPMTRGEIQSALWPTSTTVKDVTPATFRNYVSEARKAVGVEVLPEASRGADYRLLGSATDFAEFNELARQARDAHEEASIALRLQALSLVREAPFAGEVSSFFEWVHFEGLVAEINRTVSDLAYRTAIDCRRTGDTEGAETALRTGLVVSPAMVSLWEELVDVVHERDGEAGLSGLWPQAEAQLGTDGVERLRQRIAG
jgi:two-component SAPR family response regulator